MLSEINEKVLSGNELLLARLESAYSLNEGMQKIWLFYGWVYFFCSLEAIEPIKGILHRGKGTLPLPLFFVLLWTVAGPVSVTIVPSGPCFMPPSTKQGQCAGPRGKIHFISFAASRLSKEVHPFQGHETWPR